MFNIYDLLNINSKWIICDCQFSIIQKEKTMLKLISSIAFLWLILSRANLQALYNAEQSLLSFEGQQMQGAAKIMEKLGSLTFQKIQHLITTVDCQPMFDGGILINVLGQLKVVFVNSSSQAGSHISPSLTNNNWIWC